MQLSLAREEQTTGLIRKKTHYLVKTQLIASEAERHAIATLGLDEKLVYDAYEFRGLEYFSTVARWADDGFVAAVEDLLAANALENEITDIAKQVKQNVDAFLEAGGETTKSEVIEL